MQDVGDQITDCLTVSRFNKMFERIGARPASLDIEKLVIPITATQTREKLCPFFHKLPAKHFVASQPDAHGQLKRLLDLYQAVARS